MDSPVLLKVGGHEISDHNFLTELANVVRDFPSPVIIVHGGGAEISTMQQQMGIEPQYADGLRITDEATLVMVEMVLCGVVNKRLVRYLVNAGVDAIGVSGVDRGLVRAVRMEHPHHDMAFTGIPLSVRSDVLLHWLNQGVTPVIAPVCLGETSNFNVNADQVAGAVASAAGVHRAVFLTNVPGVLVDGQLAPALTEGDILKLIKTGIISGGMIPKVTTALDLLKAGVPEVLITNLQGLKTHSGTLLLPNRIPASDA